MDDSERTVDLEKLREEIERAKKLFSDPKTIEKRKKRERERFMKRYGM